MQKVSAIVASGTFTTSYQVPAQGEIAGHKIYGTVQQTGVGKTELAGVLEMPSDKDWNDWKTKQVSVDEINEQYKRFHPEPYTKEKNYGVKTACLLIGGTASIIGILVWAAGNPTGGLLMLLFPVSWGSAILIYQLSNPELVQWNKARIEYARVQKAQLEKGADNLRHQATLRFDQLYYCYRDDVVFLPGTNFCVESRQMSNMDAWANLGQTN